MFTAAGLLPLYSFDLERSKVNVTEAKSFLPQLRRIRSNYYAQCSNSGAVSCASHCRFLPRDGNRGISRHAVSVCPSVSPSVTFVDSVETNKYIFILFTNG